MHLMPTGIVHENRGTILVGFRSLQDQTHRQGMRAREAKFLEHIVPDTARMIVV
jgi:hypothetical protein